MWDASVTGSGSFTKAGGGTLTFPATASISYTGSTFVSDGSLVDLSSSASTFSGSGGSGSDVVTSSPTETSTETSTDVPVEPPVDAPIDEIDEVDIDETTDLEEEQDVAEVPFDDDQLEELVVIVEVSVLTSNDSISVSGSDSSSNISGGSIAAFSRRLLALFCKLMLAVAADVNRRCCSHHCTGRLQRQVVLKLCSRTSRRRVSKIG